jgi:hypothetical protein
LRCCTIACHVCKFSLLLETPEIEVIPNPPFDVVLLSRLCISKLNAKKVIAKKIGEPAKLVQFFR